jgi:hypothetical protein
MSVTCFLRGFLSYFAEETELKEGVTSWVQELGIDFFYARIYGGLMFTVCCLCVTYIFTRVGPKIPGIVKKKIDLICSYKTLLLKSN